MKRTILSTFILSLALSPVYALDASNAKQEKTTMSSQEKQQAGEMLAFIMVVDKNEVAAAKVAMEKSKNDKVKEFASHMNKDHSTNLHDLVGLSHKDKMELKETDLVMNLKKQGKDELVTLNSTGPESFDKVYMVMMVKGHQAALAKLDEYLMNQINNPQMKEFLTTTRTHVQDHLQKAQEIEKTL